MTIQHKIDFDRISKAIRYINHNYRSQPDLASVAAYVNMSPFHFQRMFTEWSGVSPKQFLQYINIKHAKQILKETKASLFDTACQIGLSSTGRLHDLFIHIEGMTPGEYKNGGINLTINYNMATSPFGNILIASTEKGICYLSFIDREEDGVKDLKMIYPNALYLNQTDSLQQNALSVFSGDWTGPEGIRLHLKGTKFQLKVWETLLKIPETRLATYGDIAYYMGKSNASRAVGTAVGKNPVAFLIPCHRVIQSTGIFGQYHWGADRKQAIIGWENARNKIGWSCAD